MDARIRITAGPVLYYWPRNTLTDFYARLVETPVDTIVLGEVVCSRRHEMKTEDWLALARELTEAGKEVVLATQALLESEGDLRIVRRLIAQGDHLVEAGDASALRMLAGRPFVIGPHVNVYSRPALVEHARLGAIRWVPPVELGFDAVGRINPVHDPVPAGTASGTTVETEIFAFGRLPLAFSARCFTARHLHLGKDECGFRCLEHPDGLPLATSEGRPFLALNGIQTQSAARHCILETGAALRECGIGRVRLSPTSTGFDEIVQRFDDVLNRNGDVATARDTVAALAPEVDLVDGFARRRPGIDGSHIA
ncbi:MAG: U32 family peptidase [Burkholderiales bacterium]